MPKEQVIGAIIAAAAVIIAALISRVRPVIAGLLVISAVATGGIVWSIKDYRVELYDSNNTNDGRKVVANKLYCWRTETRLTGEQKAGCELSKQADGWRFHIGEEGGRLDARGYCDMKCILW